MENANHLARDAQALLIQTEQLKPLAERMVQRTALGSLRDPALKDLLAKYGIHVNASPSNPASPPPAPLSSPSPETNNPISTTSQP